jgi:peptidoglycan/xylan/chitin deacetylase (PgdA/CDA1 family)
MWKRLVRHPWNRHSSGKIVLLYHRVACLRRDPWSLAVTPAQFESQLSVIRRCTDPVPLSQIDSATSVKPTLAITFDDGYEDNLLQAEPLLRRFEIPATIFVVSGVIQAGREFWWDELERILLDPARPRILEIDVRGQRFAWFFEDFAASSDETNWEPWSDSHPSTAHRAYREIYDLLFPLDGIAREEVMNRLRDWAELGADARPSHRPLSRQQLNALSQSPVVDIGVHTVSHSALSGLPPIAQQEEILGARAAIDEMTTGHSMVFSYPYGKREHFSEDTVRIVHDAGFTHACVNIPGLVRPETDRLRLPRVLAPALEGDAFARWLTHCFRDLN